MFNICPSCHIKFFRIQVRLFQSFTHLMVYTTGLICFFLSILKLVLHLSPCEAYGLIFLPTFCALQVLFEPKQWDHLVDVFRQEFCKIYGMTLEPSLHIYLQAGLSSLKTPYPFLFTFLIYTCDSLSLLLNSFHLINKHIEQK